VGSHNDVVITVAGDFDSSYFWPEHLREVEVIFKVVKLIIKGSYGADR
jgi:hypothetical protein